MHVALHYLLWNSILQMQGNIITEIKRRLITSFLFPEHRPRLSLLRSWLSPWGVEQIAWQPYRGLERVGLLILCDVGTGRGQGKLLTSSSKCLCFKILNFPLILWIFHDVSCLCRNYEVTGYFIVQWVPYIFTDYPSQGWASKMPPKI